MLCEATHEAGMRKATMEEAEEEAEEEEEDNDRAGHVCMELH